MDKTELLEIFTRQQRIEVDYPDVKREVDGSAQIARFQDIPQDFEWKLYDYDQPKDLIDRLRRRGFEIGDPEALLALDLAARPEALDRPVPPSVARITDPGEVDAVVALENAVWETDHYDMGERLKRDLREHPETWLPIFG